MRYEFANERSQALTTFKTKGVLHGFSTNLCFRNYSWLSFTHSQID